MNYLAFYIFLIPMIHLQNAQPAAEQLLMAVDLEFSAHSLEYGRNAAFIAYCHEDGVMLVPNSYPVRGKDRISGKLMQKPDTAYRLTWEPSYAECAASGELGYTYGIWTYRSADASGAPVILQGTYVTIWKKNDQGEWRFILDSGNDGLGETN